MRVVSLHPVLFSTHITSSLFTSVVSVSVFVSSMLKILFRLVKCIMFTSINGICTRESDARNWVERKRQARESSTRRTTFHQMSWNIRIAYHFLANFRCRLLVSFFPMLNENFHLKNFKIMLHVIAVLLSALPVRRPLKRWTKKTMCNECLTSWTDFASFNSSLPLFFSSFLLILSHLLLLKSRIKMFWHP